jgi:hypothetical protein
LHCVVSLFLQEVNRSNGLLDTSNSHVTEVLDR